jgi:hypothetical protein
VITDRASNCVAAGALVEQAYPHITWSPCVAHACDLALEDIFGLDHFKNVHLKTKEYVAFITNHHATLAAWREHQPQLAPGSSRQEAAELQRVYNLQLIKPGETRFASAHLMLARVLEVKGKLQQYVVSDRWTSIVGAMKAADKAKAGEYKALLLSDGYWAVVHQAVQICTPIYKMLRKVDGETPMAGKVHRFNFDVSEHLQGNFSSDDAPMPAATIRAVRQIWESRWEQMHSPVHGAAYCLDPQFWEDDGLVTGGGDACVEDLFTMIDKMLPDEEDQQAARLSYSSFRTKEKQFGRPSAVKDAPCMPAHQWWELYGQAHPQLQKVAVRLLSQPASACSCERNWSAYDFIHNRRRNRLTADRARKLVYVFTNGRLVNKLATSEETFIGWDEGVEDGSPLEGDEEGT